ncbi:MAG: NAD(P)/FAD-dependent oxidoreductase [Betaproteobacteria bacterium]|nr:NAD(P)/FAD-dependent oxidoreductase [Betaproteobacteria bacterium]
MKHVIIGNGPAGVIAAETLRKLDSGAEIVLIGNEQEPAYSRMAIPYLLEGNIDESGTYLRKTPGHFSSHHIGENRSRVIAVKPALHKVLLEDGQYETYDRLLIATGSHPVNPSIPGIDLPQVQTCWTLADARAIAALAKPGARVLQIGAGFIGCIMMEALVSRGVDLTVIEIGDRMVQRMMTPKASGMIKRWVEQKGVRVMTGKGVVRIDTLGDAPGLIETTKSSLGEGVTARSASIVATLTDGEAISCDLVIVAAGVAPNIDFLDDTDVHIAKGIVVDNRMRTSVADIYAAGDVTEAPDIFTGIHVVSAIQPNAAEQAKVAALNMAGQEDHFPGVMAINVLDTLGLISSSFGQWWGETTENGGSGVELIDEAKYLYLSLQFKDDVLIGATSIGHTDHIGVIRGLIQTRARLGPWKEMLLNDPNALMKAYLGSVVVH